MSIKHIVCIYFFARRLKTITIIPACLPRKHFIVNCSVVIKKLQACDEDWAVLLVWFRNSTALTPGVGFVWNGTSNFLLNWVLLEFNLTIKIFQNLFILDTKQRLKITFLLVYLSEFIRIKSFKRNLPFFFFTEDTLCFFFPRFVVKRKKKNYPNQNIINNLRKIRKAGEF